MSSELKLPDFEFIGDVASCYSFQKVVELNIKKPPN